MRLFLCVLSSLLFLHAPAQAKQSKLDPNRRELSIVPAVNYNTDRGFGFGALGTLARFRPGYAPFRWRLKLLVHLTAKGAPDGSVELPFHKYMVGLELPGLAGGRVRLDTEVGFNRFFTSGYYGIGNATKHHEDRGGRYEQYDRIYPRVRTQVRLGVTRHLLLLVGGELTYNWIYPYEGSKLEQDLQSSDRELLEFLRGTDHHGSLELNLGWAWDSRDHEYIPSRGMFHEVTWRFSPGLSQAYGGLNLTARFYLSLWGKDRLVLATRIMWDMLLGRPPFYELAEHGGLYGAGGPGGGNSVRGVPLHRYHGKLKLIGNLELRARLLPFTLFKQRFNLGGVVFVDGGRVWADTSSPERMDGGDLGLKWGVGGGPRLQWGETFLIRIDFAWSPDTEPDIFPVGVYFNVRHVF